MSTYIPSNKRPGVRCQVNASCKRGMILAIDYSDSRGRRWEVVRFHTYGHELIAEFEHADDAKRVYIASILGGVA